MTYQNTLTILEDILISVGKYQVEQFKSRTFQMTTKSTDIDMVTEVDQASEEKLMNALTKHFPEYGFLAEESGAKNSDAEHIWVIDPLDGTTNFSTGIPIFAISVGLKRNNETLLGAVYLPMTATLYTAIKGQGAKKNGLRIQVNRVKTLRESVIATGFPYDRAENPANNVEEFTHIVTKVKGIRRLGVAAYDLCLVAEGVFAGFWEYGLKPWDYTAGLLIASEAGAVYDFLEKRPHSMVVSNPELFNTFKTSLIK